MAPPWVENGSTGGQIDPVIFILLGVLLTITFLAVTYIWHLHRNKLSESSNKMNNEKDEEELETDNIGLSKKAEDTLDIVLEEPALQNELPKELEVSKATVSNAVSELKDRGLIKRKKKANTYLIEPDREELENQQR